MFEEAKSAEDLAQAAADELAELNVELGTESASSAWNSYLDSFVSKSILEPSTSMIDDQGKRFEGVRFAPSGKTPVAAYIYFDGKSKSLSVIGSYDYENHSIELRDLVNVELRFENLSSGGVTA